MNARSLQELIKNLRIFYKCPSCGNAYRQADIVFLGRIEEHCFMQLSCQHCTLPILATVLVAKEGGMAAVELTANSGPTKRRNISDLKPAEKTHFRGAQAIESAEIAELYRFLSKSNAITHIISK